MIARRAADLRDTERRLPDDTYVELVRSLFATLVPVAIMGALFIVVAVLAASSTPDPLLIGLGVLGSAVSLARPAIIVVCERLIRSAGVDIARVRRVERLFATVYLGFSAVLGQFAWRAMAVTGTDMHMVIAPLIVGYAAGVAATVSLRPWICVPAVVLAVVPLIAASFAKGQSSYQALGVVLAAMLAGGIGSMLGRYRSECEKITLRRRFASLARTDHLTGLANRLGLEEAFALEAAAHGARSLAVHCLDLDRFKQVNDRHGHPAGDLLLRQVADRLRLQTRRGDVAARLGGDEFVIIQTGLNRPDDAEQMAQRIVTALGQPYPIEGQRPTVGVSVGYALGGGGDGGDLSALLASADRALYAVKRSGGGALAHTVDPPLAALRLVT